MLTLICGISKTEFLTAKDRIVVDEAGEGEAQMRDVCQGAQSFSYKVSRFWGI